MKIKKSFYFLSLLFLVFSMFAMTSCGGNVNSDSEKPSESISDEDNCPGHIYDEDSIIRSVDPTCIEDGYITYKCINCNEDCENIIPALGHDYKDFVTLPSCEQQGYTTHICENCSDSYKDTYTDALNHDYKVSEHIDATCEIDGHTTYVCNHDSTHTYTDVHEALGHSYGDWEVIAEPDCESTGKKHRDCDACDYFEEEEIASLGHDYESVVTKPTCVEQGYTTHTCSRCDDSYVDSYVEALGHSYGDWEVTVKPGCESAGTKHRDCDVCDYFEEEEIASLGHVEVIDSVVAPTCESTGLTEGKHCDRCKEVLVAQEEVAALGHDYESVVTNPTCVEEGFTTHTCNRCDDSYVDTYIEALGHVEVIDKDVEATCTETGLTEGSHCDRCKEVLVAQEIVASLGHNYESVVTKPTCVEQGYTTHTCSRCDDSYVDSYVEALGHSYGDWKVTVKPGCESVGTKRRDCDTCVYFEEEEIASLGHDYEPVVTDPTCVEQGYTTHTCSRCDDSYVDSYKAALGHTYDNEYSYNESFHWLEAICGHEDIVEYSEHILIEGYCQVCDYFEKEELEYELSSDGTYYIVVDVLISTITDVIIPDTYNGLPVKEIGPYAFAYCDNIETILIPESVTHIRDYAFERCKSLTKIEIPKKVEYIGFAILVECSSLESIIVDEDNEKYDSRNNCNALIESSTNTLLMGCKNTIIPNTIIAIKNYAFYKCEELLSVNLPENLTSIHDWAFYGCKSLEKVEIFNNIEEIGGHAFESCSSLKTVTIPSALIEMGADIFKDCPSLKEVYFLGTKEQWNNSLWATSEFNQHFNNSTIYFEKGKLEYELSTDGTYYIVIGIGTLTDNEIIIPSHYNDLPVKEIKRNAFYGNDFITSLTIGSEIETIGIYAFFNCINLQYVSMANSVTTIGESAFRNCMKLSNIKLSSSITLIDDMAFYGCSSLVNIDLPENLENIESMVFCKCSSLSSIIIPDGVAKIDSYAFRECSNLTSITIPSSVTKIGDLAFYECNSLVDIYYNGTKQQWENITIGTYNESLTSATVHFTNEEVIEELEYELSSDGTYYIVVGIGTITDNDIVIPETYKGLPVKEIGEKAFERCSSLTSITISDSIEIIGEYAFSYCESVIYIDLSDNIITISNNAFEYCMSLSNLTIPDSVISIENYAFFYCKGLTTISIGNNVNSIGDNAFMHCSKLSNISISNSVTSIGNEVFTYCYDLKEIIIPNNVTNIGYGAFKECISLKNIQLPNKIQIINSGMFAECVSLSSIVIPDSVNYIYPSAFYNCNSLTDIYYAGTKQQWENITIGTYNESLTSATIHYAEEEQEYFSEGMEFELSEDGTYYSVISVEAVTEANIVIPSKYNGLPVTEIADKSFYSCINMESVTIPVTISSIGFRTFFNCHSLKNVYYLGTQEQWLEITISGGNNALTNSTIHYNS